MARRANAVEERVDNPSRGLVTRVPSDRPETAGMKGAFVEAQNMRFEDGVAKNAPGYEDILSPCTMDSPPNLIIQTPLMRNGTTTFRNPFIATEGKIYWLKRGSYTVGTGSILVCSIPSEESFGIPSVGRAQMFPFTIASAEAFGIPVVFSDRTIFPASIPSAETFGTALTTAFLSPTGIPSAEAFGTPELWTAVFMEPFTAFFDAEFAAFTYSNEYSEDFSTGW